jgi:hypothetical protein
MAPFYEHPMKDMRVTHNPKVFLVTEALASVDDDWTMTTGKKKTTGRSSNLLIRKGGEWKVKAMVEGGWGDMPMPEMPAAAEGGAPQGGAPEGGAMHGGAPQGGAPQGGAPQKEGETGTK